MYQFFTFFSELHGSGYFNTVFQPATAVTVTCSEGKSRSNYPLNQFLSQNTFESTLTMEHFKLRYNPEMVLHKSASNVYG